MPRQYKARDDYPQQMTTQIGNHHHPSDWEGPGQEGCNKPGDSWERPLAFQWLCTHQPVPDPSWPEPAAPLPQQRNRGLVRTHTCGAKHTCSMTTHTHKRTHARTHPPTVERMLCSPSHTCNRDGVQRKHTCTHAACSTHRHILQGRPSAQLTACMQAQLHATAGNRRILPTAAAKEAMHTT